MKEPHFATLCYQPHNHRCLCFPNSAQIPGSRTCNCGLRIACNHPPAKAPVDSVIAERIELLDNPSDSRP
jgi:hypothetical protein